MGAGRVGRAVVPLILLLIAACPGNPPRPAAAPAKPAPRAAQPEKVVWQKSKSGLGFRLSNADGDRTEKAKLVHASPLTGRARQRLFARLPRFKAHASVKGFAMRAKSIPAPRPGQTVKTAFPPAVAATPPVPNAPGGSLRVLRHAPEGDVPIAPNLSLTFSEPMVAVTSHGELGRDTIPVKLSPEPQGHWRWVGTQTVFFDPEGERFPMSTRYAVEVPAKTRAASGHVLDKAIRFSFTTPTLRIKDAFPERWGNPVDLSPVMFIELNQRIDRQALLGSLAVRAGGTWHAVRLATGDEIAKDDDVRRLVQRAEPGRFIAFKAKEPLPLGSVAEMVIKSGAPSAEGPLRTEKELAASFRVRGLLKLEEVSCGWGDGCAPLQPWRVRLSNAIDAESFEADMVKVEPELAAMRVDVAGRYLTVRGRSKGRTTYTVTLSPRIKDEFGQTLEQPAQGKVKVGEAEPMLFSEQDPMVVLDPAFGPKLSVYSVNRKTLKVRLYAVEPGDWRRYIEFRQKWDWDGKLTTPPGRLMKTAFVHPKGERDALTETRIDLSPALKDGFGQVLAIVEPPVQPRPKNRWSYRQRQWVRQWVQVTQLGLTAFKDNTDAYAWVTELNGGKAVGNAAVSVSQGSASGRTDRDGMATLRLGSTGEGLFARRGSDLVFQPESGFSSYPDEDSARWFVFDDRRLYKPGEHVHVKGWVRLAHAGKTGDLGRLTLSNRRVYWTAFDPRGARLSKGDIALDDSDGFDFAFSLPKNVNTGGARVQLRVTAGVRGEVTSHGFQVEEFRRPEFEVSADVPGGPHFVGRHAVATVSASYFAGGGLADAEVNWSVDARDAYFAPPDHEGYHFGKPERWSWWSTDKERTAHETWKAKTDARGRHRLRIDFDALEPAYVRSLDLEARITDVNRQSWVARANLLVHPADVTVGIREQSQLLRAGQKAQLDVIVTGVDGKLVTGRPVKLEMSRVEQSWRGRKLVEKLVDTQDCDLTSSAQPGRCSLATSGGGLHRVTAIVTDASGRPSRTEMDLWVLGSEPPENPRVHRDQVHILPDKKQYAGGTIAELLVMAPFTPAEGVLTLRHNGMVDIQRFHLDKKTGTVKVKLDPSWIPHVFARVDLVGMQVRAGENGEPDPSLPKRPAAASGEVELDVPPKDRTLDIHVAPAVKALAPGGSTRIALDVRDAAGRAVAGAAVALVVVDESVLALAGYDLPDPLAALYPGTGDGVSNYETRLRIALAQPNTARFELRAKKQSLNMDGDGAGFGALRRSGGGGKTITKKPSPKPPPAPAASAAPRPDMAKGEKAKEPSAGKKGESKIRVRENFNPLAAFVPRLTTDARGHASATVHLPDNLTRYRVMAVAAEGNNRFGSAQSDITARLPLMVRPSAPRFLNFGDRFSLPVVLQNQTSHALSVDVAARADNAQLYAPDALRVQVPANDRVEVRFPAAAGKPGTARFQVGAVSKAGVDASEFELPTWTPATTEAFATYGAIDQGAISQPVKMPSGVFTEVGQLEVTTSSTALQGLTDAVLYLVRYPFDCNEQIASRMLGIAALRDVLSAFHAEGLPSKKVLVATVAADIKKLSGRQHYDGGWYYWGKNQPPDPFVSVHVTNALVRAKDKKFSVPQSLLRRALYYLRDIRHKFPPWYSVEARRMVRAYALSVRARAGDDVKREARALYREAGKDGLPLDAIGWLLPILDKDPTAVDDVAAIRRLLSNRASETAGNAQFVTHVNDSAHVTLESSRRTDGILLEALVDDQPKSDLIPKLARGLLAHRKRGHWLNTQENVFILLALDRYFHEYEKVTPDFVARAWLGSQLAAEHTFKGRSVDRKRVDIPLSYLAKNRRASRVVLSKSGTGRLYYRIGMQYIPRDLRPPPMEQGFSVSRSYEAADSPSDVHRDKDGVWHVKLGARVRVRVVMVAPARRYHVALVDPMPAGFEALNAALAMTETVPRDPKAAKSKAPWWWSRVWYEHQNLRDERAEAFASLVYGGVYDYTYVVRATTPGRFVAPPPKAEEMYAPETFGRGAGDSVVIE